jgi:hypothetical protein
VVERGGPLVAVKLRPTLSRSIGLAHHRGRSRSRAALAFAAMLDRHTGSRPPQRGNAVP